MAQRQAASLTRAGPARTGVLIHRNTCGLSPSEGVIIKQDPSARVRLVEPKNQIPDRFGKKCGPSWRTWSYLARDFAGVAHPALKQAMKTVEKERQPITAQDITDFGVTMELDRELQQVSRTEGGALETGRMAERQPGLEQWRRLAAMYDPLDAGRIVRDSRQSLSPTKVTKLEDLLHALQAWENLEQRHQERTENKLPKDMKPCDPPGKGSRQHGNTCSWTSDKCVRIL